VKKRSSRVGKKRQNLIANEEEKKASQRKEKKVRGFGIKEGRRIVEDRGTYHRSSVKSDGKKRDQILPGNGCGDNFRRLSQRRSRRKGMVPPCLPEVTPPPPTKTKHGQSTIRESKD